jgi:hypothetical protein
MKKTSTNVPWFVLIFCVILSFGLGWFTRETRFKVELEQAYNSIFDDAFYEGLEKIVNDW